MFNPDKYRIVFTTPCSYTTCPARPTLCPPGMVRNPSLICSSKAYNDCLLIREINSFHSAIVTLCFCSGTTNLPSYRKAMPFSLRILISCSFSSFKTTRSTSFRSLSGKSSRISLFSKCTPPFFTYICLSAWNIPPICLDTPSYLY